jgi:Helix-turn-helix domain
LSCRCVAPGSERMSATPAEWLTVAQAAARLGVNVRTVRRRCERGKLVAELRTTDTGHAWFIDAASLGTASDAGTSDTSDGIGHTSDSIGHTSDAHRTANTLDASGPSDRVGQASDTRLARLEGYAARDLDVLIAAAVREAITPLVEEIRQLRAQVERLSESRQDAPQQPPEAPAPVEPSDAPATAQGSTGAQERANKQPLSRAPLWLRFFGIRWRWK